MPYAAAEVITQAIEEAGSVGSDDINEALMRPSYEDHISATGAIEFDDQDENANALGPVNQVQSPPVRVVYPEEYTEAEPQVQP